jgi:hypothetical protein
MHNGLDAILALLLAHVLSDFPLQSTRMVQGKARAEPRAYFAHLGVHLATALAALALLTHLPLARWISVLALLALILGHGALDIAKSWWIRARPDIDRWPLFLADQLAHVVVIIAAAALLPEVVIDFESLSGSWEAHRMRVLSEALVFATFVFPTGYLIRYLLRPLSCQFDEDPDQQGLSNAGLYLGWLERALLLFAFDGGLVAGVGLIVGAKAVARFPEFEDRAFAEYFLIGTLLSVALAGVGAGVLALVRSGIAS